MSGSPPVVTLSPASVGPMPPGALITVTATISDPDTHDMELVTDGPGLLPGTTAHQVTEVDFTDPQTTMWWWASDPSHPFGMGVNSLTITAPAVSDDLVFGTTDGEGNPATARCPVTVTPPMLVGVDVAQNNPTQLAAELALYKGLTGPTKLFWQPGHGLPTLTGLTAVVPTSAIPCLCFKDMPTKAQWLALLDTLPGAWPEVWLVPDQEGDRSKTPAAFKGEFAPLVDWSAGHPKRAQFKIVADLTWYWEHYKNADDFAEFIPPGVDLLGVDCYPGGQSNWMSPADLLAGPVAAAHAAGLRLAILEAGVTVAAGASPAVLQQRADWYAELFTVAEALGVHALTIWSAPPTAQTGTFRLAPPDPAYAVVAGRVAG